MTSSWLYCRRFEELLYSLPLLVVATDEGMAQQAGEQLLQASQGRLQHLRCLAVSSQPPSSHPRSQQAAIHSPGHSMSHALTHGAVNGSAGPLVPTRDGQMSLTESLPGPAAQGRQPYDPAVLVSGLRWLAKHRPEPPTMQASLSSTASNLPAKPCWNDSWAVACQNLQLPLICRLSCQHKVPVIRYHHDEANFSAQRLPAFTETGTRMPSLHRLYTAQHGFAPWMMALEGRCTGTGYSFHGTSMGITQTIKCPC